MTPGEGGGGIDYAAGRVVPVDTGEHLLDRTEEPARGGEFVVAIIECQAAMTTLLRERVAPMLGLRFDRPSTGVIAVQCAHAEMQRFADGAVLDQRLHALERWVGKKILE